MPNQANLAPYIAQASPGDTLLLGTTHTGFSLDKGLTLRPQSGRTQILSNPFGPFPQFGSSSVQPPAGQRAHLVDIDFLTAPSMGGGNGSGHPVTVTGVSSFEGCTFQNVGYNARALTTNGDVTLRHCTVTGSYGAKALVVQGGGCSAVHSQFTGGGASTLDGSYAQPGVMLISGSLAASHCTMSPGVAALWNGFPLGPDSGLAVTNGIAFLTDCSITGGNFPTGGVPALPGPFFGGSAINATGGTVTHARCSLMPGNSGLSTPPTPPTLGNVTVDANLVGIDSSGPLVLGTTWTVTAIAGASGQLMGFGLSFGLFPTSLSSVPEPIWIDPGTVILAGFTTPSPGTAVPAPIPIPNVLSLVGSTLWCQALQADGSLVRVSAVAGGVLH